MVFLFLFLYISSIWAAEDFFEQLAIGLDSLSFVEYDVEYDVEYSSDLFWKQNSIET